MSNLSTTIQPVIIVDGGGTPIPPVPGDTPEAFTFDQSFAAPVNETDALAVVKKPQFMALVLDAAGGGNVGLSAAKRLSVFFDSADGAAFDTALILDEILPIGTKYKWFSFPQDMTIRAGDHINIQIVAPGGADTDTVAGTVMFGT